MVKQVKANPLQAVLDKLNPTFTSSEYETAQALIAAKSPSSVTDDRRRLVQHGYLKKVKRDNYQKYRAALPAYPSLYGAISDWG